MEKQNRSILNIAKFFLHSCTLVYKKKQWSVEKYFKNFVLSFCRISRIKDKSTVY